MAGKSRAAFAFLYLTCFLAQAMQTNSLVNYNDYVVHGVPGTLWVKALRALEKHSPTHHRYSNSQMISVQELEEPPYKLYRFTFYMNPICGTESCPREACTIDLKQKGDIEDDDIEALNDSIQCMYFYTAEAQNDTSQEQQSYQDQEDFQITQESVTEQANNNRSVELAHEIQESGDEEIRPFIAMRASNNYCPGCPYELNPNLPSLLVYAEQALRSIDENTTNDYKHKLMSIIKVTRSVPVSSNVVQYQLLLLIGESGCLKNALEQEQECPLRSTDSIRQCLVTFEQRPWQPTSLKVIKNNCTDSENSHVNTSNQSQQPDLESQPLVTVKYNEAQSSRTEVADAYEGLRDMLDNYTHVSLTPSKQSEETVVTESMNVKVVLNRSQDDEKIVGFTDKAKEFGEFLEHFDLPVKAEDPVPDTREPVKEEKFQRKKVSVENLNIEKANEERDVINRRKRSMTKRQLVGAPTAVSVNDPQIQLYANKALRKVSDESDSLNEPLIVEISEATSQVVAGTLYKIKAKLGTSNCLKGTKDNCQLQAGSEVKECLIKVWSRPWLDQGLPEITVTCPPPSTSRRKRSLRGVNYNQKMLQIAEDLRTDQEFNKFVETYNRTYSTPEERNLRLTIFRENLGIIKLLRRTEQGTGRYGVNMFADMSREEFRSRYLGLRPDLRLENDIPLRKAEIPDVELPPTFDWRKKGVVTPVKNQGSCGSCWAFSVTGNVEGQYAIKHGQLLSLSEQELVDCDNLDDGCGGGLPDNAYRAIEQLGGLELESDYPYEAEDEKCHFKTNLAKVQLASAVNITSNEVEMAQWLVQNGPISVGINANAMQFYVGGVSHPFKFLCNPKNLDHGVLIVGYGTSEYPLFHKKLPYWIIKNSWGERWGEQGYYRVYRGDGTCGVNTAATSAVVV